MEVVRWTTWTQVNTDGFGDANNGSIIIPVVFGSELFAGTVNYVTGGEIWAFECLDKPGVAEGNLYDDCLINFKDVAVLADNWLKDGR